MEVKSDEPIHQFISKKKEKIQNFHFQKLKKRKAHEIGITIHLPKKWVKKCLTLGHARNKGSLKPQMLASSSPA